MSRLDILRAVAEQPLTNAEIKARFNYIAKSVVDQILADMLADKVISVAYGKLRATQLGRAQLPVAPERVAFRPYVPEKVIRRPGSDRCSTLPSRVAGRLVYPR